MQPTLCPRCHDLHWHLRVHDLRHSALSAWLAAGHTPRPPRRPLHDHAPLSIYGHGLDDQDTSTGRASSTG